MMTVDDLIHETLLDALFEGYRSATQAEVLRRRCERHVLCSEVRRRLQRPGLSDKRILRVARERVERRKVVQHARR